MAAVPDRFALGECRQRLRRIRVISRLVSVLIVLATAVALLLALRDAITNGPARSFEWLPLIETTINDIVFAAIAVYFLYARCDPRHGEHDRDPDHGHESQDLAEDLSAAGLSRRASQADDVGRRPRGPERDKPAN